MIASYLTNKSLSSRRRCRPTDTASPAAATAAAAAYDNGVAPLSTCARRSPLTKSAPIRL